MDEEGQEDQWVVLELGPKAEGEDPDIIRRSIQHTVKNADVFIPASVTKNGEDTVIQYLVEGYAFIRQDPKSESAYLRLEGTKYVTAVLRTPRTSVRAFRGLATVPSSQIDHLRAQIKVEVDQGIGVGDLVLITAGAYRQITARVEEEIPEQDSVQVFIKLRSKEALITLPRGHLQLVERGPLSAFRQRIRRLKEWTRQIKPVFIWSQDKSTWFSSIASRLNLYSRLHQGHGLYSHIHAVYYGVGPEPKASLEEKHAEWARLQKFFDRMEHLGASIDDLAVSHERWKKDQMIENVVIDGHQLAIRCAMSPGLSELTDKTGRPTGAIIGFLRSVGSFKKRFPNAKFYVCWDGSNQRRRRMYSEYKANRPSRSGEGFFEVEFLKEVLPFVGVDQAWHPEEEADDAIATLLRGPLKGQKNIVISTDRDLVQLVTETDHQLVPSVGAGKEKVYDVELVKQEYGVSPSEVVFVRAIDGDSSDNIPGARGFGLKTAAKLVKLYGSVEGIFSSNLAGLTKAQYSNLRSAEKQVKLNVELMRLCDDLPLEILASKPDQGAASGRLLDVDVQDKVLTAFF